VKKVSLEKQPQGRPIKWRHADDVADITDFSPETVEDLMHGEHTRALMGKRAVKTRTFQGRRCVHMDTMFRVGTADDWWSPTEAIRETGLARSTVYAMIKRGEVVTGCRRGSKRQLLWPGSFDMEEEDRGQILEKAKDPAVQRYGGNSRLYWLNRLLREAPGYAHAWANHEYDDVATAVRRSGIKD